MLRFRTPPEWADAGINSDVQRLFVQLWEEMFDDDSPDSWQVRTSNVRSLLAELVLACDTTLLHAPHRPNIRLVADELAHTAGFDRVMKAKFGFFPDYLKSIATELTGQPADNQFSIRVLSRIRSASEVLLSLTDQYRATLIAMTRAALEAGDSQKKGDVYRLTMLLGTEFSTAGFSSAHLRAAGNYLLDRDGGSFIQRFDRLVEVLERPESEYTCLYAVQWPGRLMGSGLELGSVSILPGPPGPEPNEHEARFYAQVGAGGAFAKVRVNALDRVAARRASEAALHDIFAAFSLYKPSRAPSLRGTTALLWSKRDDYVIEGPDSSRRAHLRDSRAAETDLAKLFALLNRLESDDIDAIKAALQYHHLAVSATSDETRFVNLWIALESLARNGEGNIIDKTCNNIAPTIALSNTHKLVTALAMYIRQFWKIADRSPFLGIFPNSSENRVDPHDVLDVLLEDENGERIKILLGLLNDPLLRYRAYRLREALRNRGNLGDSLIAHRRNIDWQLRRIYRVRNQIIHRGRCAPNIQQLMQHLQTYLVMTLHSLIHDLRVHSKWGLSDAFEHRIRLFDYFVAKLREKEDLISTDALLRPSKVLIPAP